MSTEFVMSVTDELIAELEQLYIAGWEASGEGWNAEYPGDAHEEKSFIERMRDACVPAAEKLLAERAELKRDAERYRWLSMQMDTSEVYPVGKYADKNGGTGDFYASKPDLDAAIDAAMQS